MALTKGQLQWLHEGHVLAGKLSNADAGRTSWVGVYPLDPARRRTRLFLERQGIAFIPDANLRAYHVRLFQISEALLEKSFGEEDLEQAQSFVVLGDDGLSEKLAELEVPVETLDSPRRVGYPL